MAAKNSLDVYVKLPSGKNSRYDLLSTATLGCLCDRIASEEGVLTSLVRLKYQGKVLNKSHSLTYLGVRPETILKAEFVIPKPLTVIVELSGGRREEYAMRNIDGLACLQDKIAKEEGVTTRRVVLRNEGRRLQGASLMDVGIVDNSVVRVELKDDVQEKCDEEVKGDIDQQQLTDILSSFQIGGRRVEVVFSFDTTGSMYSCLDLVRRKLRECCCRLIADIPDIRIGLVAHGDYCDQYSYVLRSVDLTEDVQRLVDFANNVPATGGGDAPECYEWALRKAQQMDWSEDSAKALVLIGDCEPHPPSYTDQDINWHDELDLLIGMGVKVYGVRALNNESAKPFYEELAERSGGCYLELRHFDVITDMFLAVCYREADGEQLDAFEKEIEDAGQMTEEKRHMFKQLEEKHDEPNHKTKHDIRTSWWDTSARSETPRYSYLADVDKWISYKGTPSGTSLSAANTSLSSRDESSKYMTSTKTSLRQRRRKRGCLLM